MQRIALMLGVGCLVALSAGGMWLASRPPIPVLFPPDATDMDIGIGWWEWTFSYRTSRPLDEWYLPVVRQLEASGWVRRAVGYTGRPMPRIDPVAYERRVSFGVVVIRERVELDGDLHIAQVRTRRWIAIQPLKLPSVLTSTLLSDR